MPEIPYGDGKVLTFEFPVYVIVSAKAMETTGLPRAIDVSRVKPYGFVLPVFTDRQAAEDYAGRTGMKGKEPLALGAFPFVEVLRAFDLGGKRCAGFDIRPTGGTGGDYYFRIAELIAILAGTDDGSRPIPTP
jgi:hypothetical protein